MKEYVQTYGEKSTFFIVRYKPSSIPTIPFPNPSFNPRSCLQNVFVVKLSVLSTGQIGGQWLGFPTRVEEKWGTSLRWPSLLRTFLWPSRGIGRAVTLRALVIACSPCCHTVPPGHVNQFQWFVSPFLTSACLRVVSMGLWWWTPSIPTCWASQRAASI